MPIRSEPYSGPEAPPTFITSVMPAFWNAAPGGIASSSGASSATASKPRRRLAPWSPSPIARSSSVSSSRARPYRRGDAFDQLSHRRHREFSKATGIIEAPSFFRSIQILRRASPSNPVCGSGHASPVRDKASPGPIRERRAPAFLNGHAEGFLRYAGPVHRPRLTAVGPRSALRRGRRTTGSGGGCRSGHRCTAPTSAPPA